MRGLVGLILEDDNTETDVTSGDDQGNASYTDGSEFGASSETDDHTANEGDATLDDSSKGHTGKAFDLLGVATEVGSERSSGVPLVVKVLD